MTPLTIDDIKRINSSSPNHFSDLALVSLTPERFPPRMEPRQLSLCLFIGVCSCGIATLSVNGEPRTLTDNQAIIITEGSVVSDISVSPEFDGVGFFLSYTMLDEVMRDLGTPGDLVLLSHNHPVFPLDTDDTEIVEAHFYALTKRVRFPPRPADGDVLRLLLVAMITDVGQTLRRVIADEGEEELTRKQRLFTDFIRLVGQNYKHERFVAWYAQLLGVTQKRLSEVISAVSGRTPTGWISKFVITEIRNQLRHTDKSVSEIARDMNFRTQSHLGKYFKEYFGITPTDYRRNTPACQHIEGTERW